MNQETVKKLKKLLQETVMLTAACEGNFHSDSNIVNNAIYLQSLKIQLQLQNMIKGAKK